MKYNSQITQLRSIGFFCSLASSEVLALLLLIQSQKCAKPFTDKSEDRVLALYLLYTQCA